MDLLIKSNIKETVVSLKDLFKIVKGKKIEESSQNTGLRYIQIEDLRNDINIKYAKPNPKNILCNKNDILIAWDGANAGTIGYGVEGAIGSTIAKMSPKNKNILSEYVGRYLQSKFKYLRDNCTGATIPHISRTTLENLCIPLPPLETQKKIAEILDAADTLRQKTKTLIEKYDQLTQSLFLAMFGDPMSNMNNYEARELKFLGKVVTGSTPPGSKKDMYGGTVPFVTPGDLESIFPVKRTLTEMGAKNSRTVKKGSLLVCCIGATIGKTDIAKEMSAFNQQINAVEWFNEVNSHFALIAFKYLRQKVISRGISTTLPILKKSEFEKIKIPVPPLPLQNQFAERVRAIEEQKAKAQASLEKSEELFQSLLQRAFNGKLV